jgi:ABC-type multidrug transport system fused ATPase/permease subunit
MYSQQRRLSGLMDSLAVLRTHIDRAVAWRLGGTVLLVIAGGLLSALAPLALKGMVDEATRVQSIAVRIAPDRLLVQACAYVLALCAGRVLLELRPSMMGSAEQRLCARLRRHFFEHVIDLSLAFHVERQAGALAQALQQAVSGCQIMVLHLVNSVVPVIAELITVIVVLASLSQPALTTAFVVTALAYFAVMRFRVHEITDSARGISDAGMNVHAMLTDCLLNVETLKCFNAEPRACVRFGRATVELEDRWTGLQRARQRMGLRVAATFALAVTAVLAIALHGLLQGTLSLGGFVLANVYLFQLVRPLEMLGNAVRDMSQAVEFIRPLRDVLAEPTEASRTDANASTARDRGKADGAPAVEDRDASTPSLPALIGIRLDDLHFCYGVGQPAVLDGISLDIAEGRSVAIVGSSGCGKSSLMRLLLRLHEPRAGSILLDGVDIGTLPIGRLRSVMAVVLQDTVLFNASVAFNIGIGKADVTPQEIEHAARLAGLDEFIASLPARYETMVGERGLKLSGGQRQRIAIARAVLKAPRIYLLDEATSMLDSATEREVLRNLRRVSASATTITIAHRLSTIQDADEIVVMDRGKFIERGDHAALIARNGIYAAMWRTQQDAGPAGATT